MKTTTIRRLTKFTLISLATLQTGMADLASRERIRRENLVYEAEQHLTDGRAAYAKGDFETAVEQYRSALSKTPAGGAATSRRNAIIVHMADGSVALAQRYRKVGKYGEARQLLEDVLIADPSNQAALRQLEYLDDPIRTNPALTYEHTQNVDQVRRLLYIGEGFYNLGQFDKAEAEFNKVLRVDRYNKAARRWLERCNNIKTDYYRAAYDQTRAKLLSEVDAAWELAVPDELDELAITPIQNENGESRGAYITDKLKRIFIPSVDFEDTPVEEAVAFLRQRSRELDVTETDPTKKGVNFIVRGGSSSGAEIDFSDTGGGGDPTNARISELKLSNVPLVQVLQEICNASGLRYRVDEFAVTLLPLDNTDTAELIARTWSVTPTFIADLGGGGAPSGDGDPFSSQSDSGSSFTTANVQDLLKQNGVEFNNGATASFIPATATLVARNTINNLDLIDNIVQQVNGKTPKQIKILTKFVEISQDNTEELGFDWSLGNTGSDFDLRGGSPGNGRELDAVGFRKMTEQLSAGLLAPLVPTSTSGCQRAERF